MSVELKPSSSLSVKKELPGQTNWVNKITEAWLSHLRIKETARDFGTVIEGRKDANYQCVSELPFKNPSSKHHFIPITLDRQESGKHCDENLLIEKCLNNSASPTHPD